jgi:hypothetical protein
VRHENVHQITAQAQLLVHHLAKKPIKEWQTVDWITQWSISDKN